MKKQLKYIYILTGSFIILLLLIFFNNKNFYHKNLRKEMKTVVTTTENKDSTLSTAPENPVTEDANKDFYHEAVSETLQNYITGKSYTPNNDITFENLRHVIVKYTGFDGAQKSGELIVNAAVADEVVEIFKELYLCAYPIEKIRLIDEYGGDDEASMEDNNTSCFNYRKIDGQNTLSDHSYGLAIDINPLYNPYVRTNMGDRNVLPVNAVQFADRSSDFPYKITTEDACYKIFTKYGWKWGGEWDSPVDYQHFYREIS